MSSSDKQLSASDAGLKIWSCVICRRRKVRCDRRDPCSNCVKNNIECHFPVTGRIPRRNQNPGAYKSPAQKQSELLSRLRRLESVVTELAAQVEDGSQDPRASTAPGPSGAVSISSSETGPTPVESEDPSVTEPSLTASSTGQQAGSEYDEEFGRLVVDKDGGLHVGNRFWSVFCGEVNHFLKSPRQQLTNLRWTTSYKQCMMLLSTPGHLTTQLCQSLVLIADHLLSAIWASSLATPTSPRLSMASTPCLLRCCSSGKHTLRTWTLS